jgi:hypothetical protein
MKPTSTKSMFRVPIRRSQWPSFLIGLAAAVLSALVAAAGCGVVLATQLLPERAGAVIVLTFGVAWFCGFFTRVPWQRRWSRWLDSRRPGILLANGLMTVPVSANRTLKFHLNEPYALRFGWYAHRRHSATWAIMSQGGEDLLLIAPMISTRAARTAGWPVAGPSFQRITPSVWLWADDLVGLVEFMRGQAGVTAKGAAPVAAAPPAITEAQPMVSMQRHDFRQDLKVLELPPDPHSAQHQARTVQILRERCPAYLDALQGAGFTSEQILHPVFRHHDHLARFSARALQQGKIDQAQAALAAWNWETVGQHFAVHTFAAAIYELQLDPDLAQSLLPASESKYFRDLYEEERHPGGTTPIDAYF